MPIIQVLSILMFFHTFKCFSLLFRIIFLGNSASREEKKKKDVAKECEDGWERKKNIKVDVYRLSQKSRSPRNAEESPLPSQFEC